MPLIERGPARGLTGGDPFSTRKKVTSIAKAAMKGPLTDVTVSAIKKIKESDRGVMKSMLPKKVKVSVAKSVDR